jgi:uncharacterized protein (UPF0305 family)
MSEIIDSDLSCHLFPADEDELDEIIRGFLEIRERHGNKTIDPALVLEHIDALYELGDIFERGTSDSNDFFTINDIEALYQGYRSRLSEIDFKNLLKMMTHFKGEAPLIKKKRKNISKKE